jgi:hypothetical protein
VSDVTIYLDTLAKRSDVDVNRIDTLYWGTDGFFPFAANEPANGPTACGDPVEFFGQAEGYPDTSLPPLMVAGGQRASFSSTENIRAHILTAKTYTGVATCPSIHEDGLVRTTYQLGHPLAEGFKVSRTFRFNAGLGVVKNTGLRAFMPRTPSIFKYVLVPNSTGQLVKYDATNCVSSPCTVTDWNGSWFTHDDGYGDGFFIIRDPSSTAPAFVGIQFGGISNANFSSIVLNQPPAGWSGTVTETEYICFYDHNTWVTQGPTLPNYCNPISPLTVKGSKKPATTR